MKSLKIGDLLARIPIVQGGMGVGVSLSGLASAVANEGGVGVISSAGLGVIYKEHSSDYNEASIWGLKEELRKAREATRGIIGVNVMVAMSNFADMVKTAIAEKADIIFSGAGLPLNLPSFLTEGAKTKLAPIVSSARAAKLLCEKWLANYNYIPDAIVVEGPKAGGHLGFKRDQISNPQYALEEVLPEVVKEVREFGEQHNVYIPVIAAGGIYTGEDIYRTMQLGADGVQMGTRFVATEECDAAPAFKQSYVDAQEEDIEIIIGAPKYRGDEYAIDFHYLGPDGYAVKAVGNKIIVLYGSDNSVGEALDHLKETVFGITSKTKKLTEVVVTEDKLIEEKQTFTLTSATVMGNDLKSYVLEYPTSVRTEVGLIQNNLYNKVGLWLP